MPSLTIPLSSGCFVVAVNIRPGPAQVAQLQAAGEPIPSETQVHGFLDTGATNSVVDLSVMRASGMAEDPIGCKMSTLAPPGNMKAPAYDLEVRVTDSLGQTKSDWIQVRVGGAPVGRGMFCNMAVGMDILQHFTLLCDGPNGIATLSW